MTRYLNDQGYKTRTGKSWTSSTLRNETAKLNLRFPRKTDEKIKAYEALKDQYRAQYQEGTKLMARLYKEGAQISEIYDALEAQGYKTITGRKWTDHWQNPHQIGPEAEDIFKKLMDAFQIDPISNWDSDVGLELRKHLLDIDIDKDLGWVKLEDLALLSKTLAGETIMPPVDDAAESNLASNFLPKQLELHF